MLCDSRSAVLAGTLSHSSGLVAAGYLDACRDAVDRSLWGEKGEVRPRPEDGFEERNIDVEALLSFYLHGELGRLEVR